METINCEDCIHSVINILPGEFEGDRVCGCKKHDIYLVAFWEEHRCKDFQKRKENNS